MQIVGFFMRRLIWYIIKYNINLTNIHVPDSSHLKATFNPYLMNGFSHHHFGESTFMFRDVRSDLEFLFHFSMKFP